MCHICPVEFGLGNGCINGEVYTIKFIFLENNLTNQDQPRDSVAKPAYSIWSMIAIGFYTEPRSLPYGLDQSLITIGLEKPAHAACIHTQPAQLKIAAIFSMLSTHSITVVGIHTAGEVCDVVVDGVPDVPGATMYEKMMYMWQKADGLRQLLLNEPRGCSAMCANVILPPCNPAADAGFLTMEHEEYPPMSGANTIAVATVLLETGRIPMKEPVSTISLDAGAGLITATAECSNGKARSVAFDNVPAFVFALDVEVHVPGLGTVQVDIAWGGMIYCLVDASSVGMKIESANGSELVTIGERIKRAVQEQTNPVHPENDRIRGVSILEFTEPIRVEGDRKSAVNTVVVSPGRLDRSPCGTGTCARLAVLHARGQLAVGEKFHHQSVIGSEFIGHIRGVTRAGTYDAVLPTVRGSAWITSHKQVLLDPEDPYPEGFRVGDKWQMSEPGRISDVDANMNGKH